MATTRRSDMVEQLEVALADEAYDGGFGPLTEAQFSAYVRRLAETATEVVDSMSPSLRADGHPLRQNEECHPRSGEPQTRTASGDEQDDAQQSDGASEDHQRDVPPNVVAVDVGHLTTLAPRRADVHASGDESHV